MVMTPMEMTAKKKETSTSKNNSSNKTTKKGKTQRPEITHISSFTQH